MSTAVARPGAPLVERAARVVIDAGLGRGRSAFTPDVRVWTPEAAAELDRCYVQRPDAGRRSFLEKLWVQLADATPEAIQLAAELLYLQVLPLMNVGGKAKNGRITTVLSWLPTPVEIPGELRIALDAGVFSGGTGFNTGLWSHLAFLIKMVQAWWRQDEKTRASGLADPWAFRAFLASVEGPPSIRNSLKYLAFPDAFEAIVSDQNREQIRNAYRDLLPGPPGDVDRDLVVIRRALQEQSPDAPVHFYLPPWKDVWSSKAPLTPGRHVWLVRPPAGAAENTQRAWLADGEIALGAEKLRVLPSGATIDQVRQAVGLDYSSVEYVRQADLSFAFHTFLSVMAPGDVVVTVLGDQLCLGTLEDAAAWFSDAALNGRLRRKVSWRALEAPLPVAELPSPIPAHLAAPGLVVDLSEDLDLLLAILSDDETAVETESSPLLGAAGEQPELRPATDELAGRLHVDRAFLQEWIELLADRQQIIFYGPPGTGKTFIAERLARFLADAGQLENERVALVQFHPSTSYEDFIEGYRPTPGGSAGTVRFELVPGPLSQLVAAAREDPERPYFLIIDEINRANLAKVFGELYYLLEYRDSGIQLLYRPGRQFTLPRNVFLIGTMNTADRSIALVDAAMRRRFAFVELHPDDEPVKGLLPRWLVANNRPSERADLLAALNDRIDDRDFKIGPSYLMKADADRPGGLNRVWRYSILPLLVEHHYGQLSVDQVAARYGIAALRRDLPSDDDPAIPSASADHDG